MMVRTLNAEDNAALLALARRRTTGREEFRVDRCPDFFALGRRFGDTTVYGAFSGGTLLGSVSVSKQLRFVDGAETWTTYLHDLRTDPAADAHAFVAMARFALRTERATGAWPFATVLGGNPVEAALVRAVGRMFGRVQEIGTVTHVALSPSPRQSPLAVTEVEAAMGARLYTRWASRRFFAPADARGWSHLSGRWLVASRGHEALAVTLAARETDRRIVTTDGDHVLDVGYLAFTGCRDPADEEEAEAAFVAHVSRAPWASWSLVCRGRVANAPTRGRAILASTTYVFGRSAEGRTVEQPELTLV
jgi:hypothetical protein